MIAPLIVASSTDASFITRTSLLVLVESGAQNSALELVGVDRFDMFKNDIAQIRLCAVTLQFMSQLL